jgi:uncharacterized membrane protein YfcA
MLSLLLLFFAACLAGVQNALAGGGSFLTFPCLLMTGLDARAANIASTLALFPGQLTTAWACRRGVEGLPTLSFRALALISLLGGVVGALLLLATPVRVFDGLVPWLVLFATCVFAWGSFFRRPEAVVRHLPPRVAALAQFFISVYGGYFGGGIGLLMLAVLTLAGQNVRVASSTKMILAALMNASAVAIFLVSASAPWLPVLVTAVGAILGGQIGARIIFHVPEKILRAAVVALGIVLTIALFVR